MLKRQYLKFMSPDLGDGSGGAGGGSGDGNLGGASDGSGSGNGGTNPFSDADGAGAPPTPQGQTPPAAQVPPAGAPAVESWTPEKIQSIIAEAAKAGAGIAQQPPAQAAAPVQMSQEEIDKHLGTFRPAPEQIAALLEGGENSVAAMQAIVEGAVKNATTISWLQAQMIQRQMMEQLNPVMSQFQTQQVQALQEEFFAANPDLKNQMRLLGAVKAGLDQEGALNGKSKAEAFKLIADRAKEVLQATGAPAAQAPAEGGGMAQLSRGSQHGAAAPSGQGGATTGVAQRIFG